jgi:hypothetical protein
MSRVTTRAALSLYRHVFIDERPLFVGMAFEANLVSIGKRPDLAQGGRAMNIVAVAALNQAFVDSVVIGLAKVSLGSRVAAVAKCGLRLNQQVLLFFGVVRGMAVQTTYVVAGVCRSREMALFMFFAMATQAASTGVLPRQPLEADDFGDVATALYMLRSGAVTGFAAVPIVQGGLKVRRGFEALFVQIFVARLACIDSDVLSGPVGRWCCDILLLPGGNSGLHEQQQQER